MTPKKVRSAKSQIYKTLVNSFTGINFNFFAKMSKFKKRKQKKLSAQVLLLTFLLMALNGSNSFRSWAEEVGVQTSKKVSAQAIWKRVNSFFVRFLRLVLNEIFLQHIKANQPNMIVSGKLKKYKRILIQDSTIIHLPDWLAKCYPGNYSLGEIKALIKIQIVYELRTNKIEYFEITPYAKNDQSMSREILTIAKKDDLVLRDLGYFVLDSFKGLNENEASFISRLKPAVKIYDQVSGKEINLAKILKRDGRIDRWVLVGKEKQVRMRLVAQKLPEDVAYNKIEKVKKDRDWRKNHNKEYLYLLHFNIYVTNISQGELSTKRIAEVYRLRWRIENIFKSWKSYLKLQKLIPSNIKMTKDRADSIILMMLIFIIKFQLKMYNMIIEHLSRQNQQMELSLEKWTKVLAQRFEDLIKMTKKNMIEFALQYCLYEKRNDRKNFNQNPILS